MDDEELSAWLRLLETPQVGRLTARRLLAALGTPQAVFQAPRDTLRELVNAAQVNALVAVPDRLGTLLTDTREWLAGATAAAPRRVVTLGDSAYPQALLQTADPPLLLYAQGKTALLNTESLAMVGSRHPTPQGLETARAFAAHLGGQGLTIVSGMAIGIDGAAHEGALDAEAASIAVVGTGLDRVYPARHRKLAHRLAEQGLLISEFGIGMPPMNANFPQRNRIIAGLSCGTLVVEAALQSGSLITARLAAEEGREVFAVPGSIHSPQSRGCHALIKQGAKLVESADDVLEELKRPTARSSGPSEVGPEAEPGTERHADGDVLQALGHDPVSLDALTARTGRSTQDLNHVLLELELSNRVARLPGQLFQRIGYG